MGARLSGAAVVLCTVLALAAGSRPVTAADGAPFGGTAFDVTAEAYPVQPAFGSHQEPLGAKLLDSRAEVSNPPLAADARAAAADLGMIEGFTGPVGPAADSSTVTRGHTGRQQVGWHGMSLGADAERAPRAAADATGQTFAGGGLTAAAVRSAATADGSGRELVATAGTWLTDASLGPLTFAAGRFDARVVTDGRPGHAHATGLVTVTGAAVGGIPVALTSAGVQVDRSRVPADQVGALTAALHQALGRSGYADIRLVQPLVTVARDGSAASVQGGGIELFLSSHNATNDYFVDVTALGGSAAVALGAGLDDNAAPFVSALHLTNPRTAPATAGPRPDTPTAASTTGDGRPPRTAPGGQLAAATSATARLPGLWSGWPWLLVAVGALALAGGTLAFPFSAPWRRRLTATADAVADRYLRG